MKKPGLATDKNILIAGAAVLVAAVSAGLFAGARRAQKAGRINLRSPWKPVRRDSPAELPKTEWKRTLLETKSAIGNKDLGMLSAGVAYFATLAFFPTLAALVAIYALVADPSQIVAAGRSAQHVMPPEMANLIVKQLVPLAADAKTSLITGLIAVIIALWSASAGSQNLIKALNHAYDVEERRGFIKLKLISLAITLGSIILALPLAALLLVNHGWVAVLRWPVLLVVVTAALAAVYRYAPDRRNARWQIVSWGGAAATVIWMLGTALFFLYVQYLASFSKTYGIFAGIIILMTWLNLSAMIILIGAEVNNRLERRVE